MRPLEPGQPGETPAGPGLPVPVAAACSACGPLQEKCLDSAWSRYPAGGRWAPTAPGTCLCGEAAAGLLELMPVAVSRLFLHFMLHSSLEMVGSMNGISRLQGVAWKGLAPVGSKEEDAGGAGCSREGSAGGLSARLLRDSFANSVSLLPERASS